MESDVGKKAIGEALDPTVADFKSDFKGGKDKDPKRTTTTTNRAKDESKVLQKDIKALLIPILSNFVQGAMMKVKSSTNDISSIPIQDS